VGRRWDRFSHQVVATRVKPIQASVERYGGMCAFQFSQCQPPVMTMIIRSPDTSYGICEALSTYWIREHARGGSLWNFLYAGATGGGKKGAGLNMGRLMSIMTLHAEGGHAVDNAAAHVKYAQENASERWLEGMGVLRRKSSSMNQRIANLPFSGNSLSMMANGKTTMFDASSLADDICAGTARDTGHYQKIGVEGKGGAHAMAAWVANDVCFFDPNFGEFWFETKDAFKKWFTSYFWKSSMYAMALSGSYHIRAYAGKA
jgi:YopT-type cysteine protease-like protein